MADNGVRRKWLKHLGHMLSNLKENGRLLPEYISKEPFHSLEYLTIQKTKNKKQKISMETQKKLCKFTYNRVEKSFNIHC